MFAEVPAKVFRRFVKKQATHTPRKAQLPALRTLHVRAAVQLARAGMPLNLIQQQLGHANITQTMRYARFHPEYGDVGRYFETVEERLGLRDGEATPHCSPHPAAEGASD